ncbi:UDP-glucose/GDP-mannose dehydrogenase family protein [Candidatus Nitrosopelagicus sp.]|nr:UDP-glucose/GDP-mannose dehydrogenase family protein [Candidatus Nitrosopelagicus sp.]
MKIGIIGLGFVGLSLTSVLSSKGYDVIGIDVDKEKREKIINGISPFFEPELENLLKKGLKKKLKISDDFSLIKDCDFIFVTVGTPQNTDGSINLSIIKKAVTTIGEILKRSKKKPIILVKSTVIPGTMRKNVLPILEKKSNKKAGKDFGLISNPEFLQESTAIKDTKFPHVIVLGGYETEFMKKAKKLFMKLHPNVPIIITNHQTAEMIKYANNSFLATKISFINQLSNICQKIPGANVDDIAKTIGLDPRIGKLFLSAGPGYGGSCLPKDMKALINFANTTGVNPTLLNAVEQINTKQLEQIISITKKKLGNLKSKRITILGTAFKPGTDDIRDSIAIELIKKLQKRKANITIHDPKSMKNTEKIFGDKIKYAKTIADAFSKSQCVIIMTQWKQYSKINNNNIKKMEKRIIIDSRRILAEKELVADYQAIGIGNNQ